MIGKFSPGLRSILGNTGWLMADRVVRMGMGVFVGVWVARYLGPSQFGNLSFAVSFVALFGTIGTLGLESIVARDIVRDPADTPEILGTAFTLRAWGSILAPLLAFATIRLIQPNDRTTLLLVGLLSVGLLFQAFDTIDSYFQSQVKSKLTVLAKNSAFLLAFGVRVLLINAKAPLWSFAAAQVAELGLGAIGLLVGYRWSGGDCRNAHPKMASNPNAEGELACDSLRHGGRNLYAHRYGNAQTDEGGCGGRYICDRDPAF